MHRGRGKGELGESSSIGEEEGINEEMLAAPLLSFSELRPQAKRIKTLFARSKVEQCTKTISGESSWIPGRAWKAYRSEVVQARDFHREPGKRDTWR